MNASRGHSADQLAERVKELNCLYSIARLFSRPALTRDQLLRQVVELVLPAWQYSDRACARLRLRRLEVKSRGFAESSRRLRQEILVRHRRAGWLEVAYLPSPSGSPPPAFLPEEKKLLLAIAELLGNIVEKLDAEEALRESARQLKLRSDELERKNIALREIVAQIEIEKSEIQERMVANIERLVLPTLARLRSPGLPEELRGKYMGVVEQGLEQIASGFARRVTSPRTRLSPREVEICNLIRGGFSNKEIAGSLGLSALTVERHRHNIRRKLDIAGKKVNLTTFLQQM